MNEDMIRYFYDSGEIFQDSYFVNDEFSRSDGPAIIHYLENGDIWATEYWFLGDQYDSFEQVKSAVKLQLLK